MAEQRRSKKAVRVTVPPDGGYGWVVLIACFLISFVVDGCMYSFGVVLGDIKDNYQVSQEKANLLTSLMTGFLFCSGPVVSSLTKQFGIRPVVMVGAVITALMHVFSAFSPSIYLMMLFYGVIGGISTGCTYISSLIIVADYFDKKQGLATGVTMAGSGVGAFAFAPFSQWITSLYDWKFALIIWASIIIQCCVMGALLRPVPTKLISSKEAENRRTDVKAITGSTLSVSRGHDDDDDDDDEENTSCIKSCGRIVWNIIKEICNVGLLGQNFAFLLITLSNFFIFAGYFIPFLYIPIRARELEIENFALVLSIIGIVNIPARLVFGALADKLSPVHLNSMCAILATGSLWIYPPLNTFALQCVFAVIFATGISGTNCLTTPYLKEIVGMEKFSNAMGIINLFRGIGCFIGPFVGGFISDKTQSSVAAFLYSAIVFSIGTVCTILVSVGGRYKWFKNYHKYQVARQNDPDI